ncbi:AMP-binding protein [Nonomuraea sp. NPDC003214]
MTWSELVMGAAPRRGDRPAVSDVRSGEVLSYAIFASRVKQVAAGLHRHGLRRGERVLVRLPVGASLPVAVHGVAWAGGIASLDASADARLMIGQGPADAAAAAGVQRVFAVRAEPGAAPFGELRGHGELEFGPLAGPALALGGRVFDHTELGRDLRVLPARLSVRSSDVVLAAVSDVFTGLRLLDLALMVGAHVVVAHEPTLIGCRVLAQERRATLAVAPHDLAKRLLGEPSLRVLDERALVDSLIP